MEIRQETHISLPLNLIKLKYGDRLVKRHPDEFYHGIPKPFGIRAENQNPMGVNTEAMAFDIGVETFTIEYNMSGMAVAWSTVSSISINSVMRVANSGENPAWFMTISVRLFSSLSPSPPHTATL